MTVRIVNKSGFPNPQYKTEGSVGMDLQANLGKGGWLALKPMERKLIPTGIRIELPYGYEAQVRGRSGLAMDFGISMTNGIGTIDSDYRGEIGVLLINLGDKVFKINNGDRIAQLVVAKVEQVVWENVEVLSDTIRGEGGYGHTGV